jgi:hypothetical protein
MRQARHPQKVMKMFDRIKPCAGCPFKVENQKKFRFPKKRLIEIQNAVSFQCHLTLSGKPKQCAGLMAILARDGKPNQIMQVAVRLGYLDIEKLDPEKTAYASWQKAIEALTDE